MPRVLLCISSCASLTASARGQDVEPGLRVESRISDSGFGIRGSKSSARRAGSSRDCRSRRPHGRSEDCVVTALRGFAEGLSGARGDEGTRIRTSVADMRAVLKKWDDAILSYRAAPNRSRRKRGRACRLGTAHLDRGLTSEAVDQFRRAVTLAPRWGEASLLLALAQGFKANVRNRRAHSRPRRVRRLTAPPSATRQCNRYVMIGDEREITKSCSHSGIGTIGSRVHRRQAQVRRPSSDWDFCVRLRAWRQSSRLRLCRWASRLLHAGRYDEAVASFQAVEHDPLAAIDDSSSTSACAAGQLRKARFGATFGSNARSP